MLDPDTADVWLSGSNDDCQQILKHPSMEEFTFYPASKAVGNIRNQDAELIESRRFKRQNRQTLPVSITYIRA